MIRPPAVECVRLATTSIQLPLGVAYIAAALEASGRSVRVIDAVGEAPQEATAYIKGYLVGLRLEEIASRVPEDADWVGISVIFTHEWPAVVRLIDLIKARLPKIRIAVGGEHVTSMPEFCLVTSRADYAVLGEGEETAVELSEVIEGRRHPKTVDGLGFVDRGEVVVNRRRARRIDVDAIARPAWRHFDIHGYHRNGYVGSIYSDRVSVPILATRGCPYQCTYCSSPNMWTTRWVARDPVKVVDEMEHWYREYGARSFPFQDLTAIIRKDWIVAFCEELLRRKLDVTWQLPSGTRSEAIDREVASLLRRTNMMAMAYAPESGSEETRQLIKKRIHEDRLFESIGAAVAEGLNVSLFCVIGFPHETNEHLQMSLPFLARCAASGVTDVSVCYYMALPGTELFGSLYDSGHVKIDREYFEHILQGLAILPVESFNDRLSRTDLFVWKSRLFREFYSTRSKARGGLASQVTEWAGGLRSGQHQTKVETGLRNLFGSVQKTVVTRLARPWATPAEVAAMFAGWDDSYRAIRRRLLDAGVSEKFPKETAELHKASVARRLKPLHERERRLPIM